MKTYVDHLTPEDVRYIKSPILQNIYEQIGSECVIGLLRIAEEKRKQGKASAYKKRGVRIYVPQSYHAGHEIEIFCGRSSMQKLCFLYSGIYIHIYNGRSAFMKSRNHKIKEAYQAYQKNAEVPVKDFLASLAIQFDVSISQVKNIIYAQAFTN